MTSLDVRSAVLLRHGRVTAVGAFEITHPLRVHHFLVSPQFDFRSESRTTIRTRQLKIPMKLVQMFFEMTLLTKALVAPLIRALQRILDGGVRKIVLFMQILGEGDVIAMLAFENGAGTSVNTMSREQMFQKIAPRVHSVRTIGLTAVETIRRTVVLAHMIL